MDMSSLSLANNVNKIQAKRCRRALQTAVLGMLVVLTFLQLFTYTGKQTYYVSIKKSVKIVSQHHQPHPRANNGGDGSALKRKRILFWGTFYGGSSLETYCIQDDQSSMSFCGVECDYSVDQSAESVASADALIIHGREYKGMELPSQRTPDQRWVFLMFESQDNSFTHKFEGWDDIFNWTMTYRSDSDVVIPYGRVLQGGSNVTLGSGKKLVAWAVSNCAFVTSNRHAIVQTLSNFMTIDTYGVCGSQKCPGESKAQCSDPAKCADFLGQRYKFYLAFENSICEDYITEKAFNALKYGMVPIVHGPSRKTYERLLPPQSFIHVGDFPTLKALAEYILHLDKNEEAYRKYFRWKERQRIDPVYYFPRAWCSLCEKLTQEEGKGHKSQFKTYGSMHDWWFHNNSKTSLNFCRTVKLQDNTVLYS